MRSTKENGRPARRRTQLERNQEAERRLLDAALRLVAEKGTSQMTLADVANQAGYSTGLVSHHFGSKAGLLLALVSHVQRIVLERMQDSSLKAEGLMNLLGIAGGYLRPDAELQLLQRALYALRIAAMLPADERFAVRMSNYYRECEAFVERQLQIGIERGEINSEIDPAAYSLVFLCTLQGIISQWMLSPDKFNLEQARLAALRSVRRTLAPVVENRSRRKRVARS